MGLKATIASALKDPRKAVSYGYGQFSQKVNRNIHNLYSRLLPTSNIFNEDWDNLIILDGCRYDLLEPSDFPDRTINHRISRGSHTVEFLRSNICNQFMDDIVWVSGNPQLTKFEEHLYKVVHVWKDSWDQEHRTVMPEQMFSKALQVHDTYPNKRLVIHFIQPHYPFIGENAKKKLENQSTFQFEEYGLGTDYEYDIWGALERGEVEPEVVWQAYRENLEVALPFVRKLGKELQGKTIVSSDHGNAFGDWTFPVPLRIYGHPRGFFLESLRKVPWIVFDEGERKNIVASDQGDRTYNKPAKKVQERLQDLGYKN